MTAYSSHRLIMGEKLFKIFFSENQEAHSLYTWYVHVAMNSGPIYHATSDQGSVLFAYKMYF